MGKRAESAALKAYPEEITVAYGPLPGADGPCEFDDNRPYRVGFIEGYEQAEKDLALAWEDIRKIVILFSEVTAELFDKADANEMCKETLRRFNEYKEGKKCQG